MNIFWKNVFGHGMRQIDIVEATNKAKTTVHGWIKRDIYPPLDCAMKISKHLNISLEELLEEDESFDPASSYIKKNPQLRSLMIKLGLHPELIIPMESYLNGYMDSHGYGSDDANKESMIG